MLKGAFPVERLKQLSTSFYYYDVKLLQGTLDVVKIESGKYGYHMHYAVKASANLRVFSIIAVNDLGAGCVSGGGVQAALDAGFPIDKIVSAGVSKADWEINLGLDSDISCFNVEPAAELETIDELVATEHKVASIALRINPEVDTHTYTKIMTDMKENKFGINLSRLGDVLGKLKEMKHVKLIGIHSHIGPQIADVSSLRSLIVRLSEIQEGPETHGVTVENLNFGGGLGIDYYHPNYLSIPAPDNHSVAIHKLLQVCPGQQAHFEPEHSVVTQCGTLISKALYTKERGTKRFVILDASSMELIRPVMYDAYHRIENINSDEVVETYDVADPICKSSDVFGKDVRLNKTRRSDLIALRSAGAYGRVMASQYNCRHLSKAHYPNMIK